MGLRAPLLFWTLILVVCAVAAQRVARHEGRYVMALNEPQELSLGERLRRAQVSPASLGSLTQRALTLATRLTSPGELAAKLDFAGDPHGARVDPPSFAVASIAPPDGAKQLRAAMGRLTMHAPHAANALAALRSATGALPAAASEISAYGELEADIFASHRLTILQLGDSHTAADFFSGRVRERLQQVFGTGGDAYLVPGKPHLGVRSALFDSEATDGWSYEALQRSDLRRKFYLSGFNSVAHRAGAALTLRSRGGRAYDRAEIAFLKQPGGGKAEVLLDGASAGEVNLDGAADERIMMTARPRGSGFREIAVRALDDSAVTVTGVEVGREGDGVSYMSLGFPGATVQLLQKLESGNIADDLRRMAPDVVVLAFGTNEGFNDNLDVTYYISQYEQIVRRLQALRPGLKIVIIGPPDAARPYGVCHAAGVGQSCTPQPAAQVSVEGGSGHCRFPVPPKLNLVREAQRKLAERLNQQFWDWSSVQPGPCGAQVWAAANPPLMAHDYVHMTLEGYKQSADRFADFLIPLIEGRQTTTHVVSNN